MYISKCFLDPLYIKRYKVFKGLLRLRSNSSRFDWGIKNIVQDISEEALDVIPVVQSNLLFSIQIIQIFPKIPMKLPGGSAGNNFSFTGCPEKLPNLPFLELLIASFIIKSLSYLFSQRRLQKMVFFCNFPGHPVKQKLFYRTPPTWIKTIKARFPHNFVFWALGNAHSWQ